jgi:hypothetical protein
MKQSIILLSILTMTLSSFKTIKTSEAGDAAAERMALNIVHALQHNSLEEYTTLYPSLISFYDMMEKNAVYYGNNLDEAKRDFELQYHRQVIPALNHSFNAIITKGKTTGIDWKTIKLVGIELGEQTSNSTATITFTSNNKEYRLKFHKALFLDGEWKVSQYVELV